MLTVYNSQPKNLSKSFYDLFFDFDNHLIDNVVDSVVTSGKDIQLFLEAPGVSKESLSIEVQDSTLIVKAKKAYGNVTSLLNKSFNVGKGYDLETLEAEMKDGVLKITIQKTPEKQRKKIQVKYCE